VNYKKLTAGQERGVNIWRIRTLSLHRTTTNFLLLHVATHCDYFVNVTNCTAINIKFHDSIIS